MKKMHTKQRKFQQPKCLHVITCLLFSCLVLVLEWQATLATPIISSVSSSSSATSSTATAAAASATTVTRRLRNHEKLTRSRVGGGGGGGFKRIHGGGIEGISSAGGTSSSSPCEHKSLSELIKTSPVILKALGAHIFNHDDDEDLRILHNSNDALLLKWQNEQNKVLTSLKRTQKLNKFTSSSSTSSSSASKVAEKTRQQQNKQNKQQQQQTFSDAATNRAAMLASMNADAILITLTPETIYKGASLLKMTPNAAEHATSHSSSSSSSGTSNGASSNNNNNGSSSSGSNTIDSNNGNSANSGGSGGSGYNSGTINSSEASYLYEGQLNATVQPLSCFDENLLKMLPSDLIIFGKLITIEEQQRQQDDDDLLMDLHDYSSSSSSSATLSQRHQHLQQQQGTKDILKISINGLHRWSSQFENYIWKHLGWDDWSDFTVCSVACGKGVQQRFRRCLLDNPMVNLKMNFNNDDDEEDDDVDVDLEVDTDVLVEVEENDDNDDTMLVDDEDSAVGAESEQYNKIDNEGDSRSDGNKMEVGKTITTPVTTTTDVNYRHHSNDNVLLKADSLNTGNMLHFITTEQTEIRVENSTTEEPEVMRIFEGHFNDTFSEKTSTSSTSSLSSSAAIMNNEKSFNKQLSSSSSSVASAVLKDKKDARKLKKQQQQSKVKRKKHKSAKLFSTMFCEGYNIEQRNCNSFECSDDINDLLKFYRKYPTNDETNTASTQTMIMDLNTVSAANLAAAASSSSSYSTISGSASGVSSFSSFSSTINSDTDGTEMNNQNINTPLTTPINMGYVQNWHNSLNFTIMLTLRVKNDSCTTATIFSIRNSTHNLYLESCKDGLRLYLERDKTTEMLPIKFNLYDYHWHQVAISIQNGDFISIHVDCSWTNSFVVSKRLFSLPVAADVEIGRGFTGELQQLLILPEHQERYQCSEKRISINEVKRYIIDTFIDDYAN